MNKFQKVLSEMRKARENRDEARKDWEQKRFDKLLNDAQCADWEIDRRRKRYREQRN